MVAVAVLTVIAVSVAVMALHRASGLTTAVAATPPSFPPAVSASSVPIASASATSTDAASASATSTPTSASSAPSGPVVAFLGDDFLGDGASSNANRWTSIVSADFGWTEKDFGFAGTGYSTGGTVAGGTPYTARIAALAATNPSIVIVEGGRYDIESPNGPTKIKTGVTTTFAELRVALPHATIIAESPTWSLTKPPATLALVAADVKAAVVAVGGRYLDIGEPLVGVPADLGPHALPNDAGYALLAKAFETAYRS
jgi:GDSL-like lipase/acylhydrolase family protein